MIIIIKINDNNNQSYQINHVYMYIYYTRVSDLGEFSASHSKRRRFLGDVSAAAHDALCWDRALFPVPAPQCATGVCMYVCMCVYINIRT